MGLKLNKSSGLKNHSIQSMMINKKLEHSESIKISSQNNSSIAMKLTSAQHKTSKSIPNPSSGDSIKKVLSTPSTSHPKSNHNYAHLLSLPQSISNTLQPDLVILKIFHHLITFIACWLCSRASVRYTLKLVDFQSHKIKSLLI